MLPHTSVPFLLLLKTFVSGIGILVWFFSPFVCVWKLNKIIVWSWVLKGKGWNFSIQLLCPSSSHGVQFTPINYLWCLQMEYKAQMSYSRPRHFHVYCREKVDTRGIEKSTAAGLLCSVFQILDPSLIYKIVYKVVWIPAAQDAV